MRFFVHSKIFCCATPISLSTSYKWFIFIMIYCFESLYFCWNTCITRSRIYIIIQFREFLVPSWTKGSARFSKKNFWKGYMFRLIFLWDFVKRSIRIFWIFYALSIIFIWYVIMVIVVGCFPSWIISGETCKSFCRSGEWGIVWELVVGSFLSKIALIDRQFWLAFCNGFFFSFFGVFVMAY